MAHFLTILGHRSAVRIQALAIFRTNFFTVNCQNNFLKDENFQKRRLKTIIILWYKLRSSHGPDRSRVWRDDVTIRSHFDRRRWRKSLKPCVHLDGDLDAGQRLWLHKRDACLFSDLLCLNSFYFTENLFSFDWHRTQGGSNCIGQVSQTNSLFCFDFTWKPKLPL